MEFEAVELCACPSLSSCLLQFHPDVNKEKGAEDKFKEISNAYEVRRAWLGLARVEAIP